MKYLSIAMMCFLGVLGAQEPDNPPPAYLTQPDCSALSPEEQQFAGSLKDTNKMVFCQSFTPAQRAIAMQLAPSMTPDSAVEQVAQNKNMQTPSQTSTSRKKQYSQGCPVKPATAPKS